MKSYIYHIFAMLVVGSFVAVFSGDNSIANVVGNSSKSQSFSSNSVSKSANINAKTPTKTIPLTAQNSDSLPPIYIEHVIKLKKGQTISSAIAKTAVPQAMKAQALHQLQRKFNVKNLRAGQEILLRYKLSENNISTNSKPQFIDEISFFSRNDKAVKVTWNGEKYKAKVSKRSTQKVQVAAIGEINGSLYLSAQKAGLPASLVGAFVNLFSWELDFTRDIRSGNKFKVVYEQVLDDKGEFIRNGKIIGAELVTNRKTHNAFRFVDSKGRVEYYDSKGINKKRSLLRTPLEFSRISSHFNLKRKHPILGYTRAHKGTDFAAPRGTPIKASGNGKVEFVGWHGGYGKYIKIKHNNGYKTAYAHLHRYARGLKKGKKVKQGQIIGYVGSTGRSTGPHLHYELLKNKRHLNPLRVKLPNGRVLPKSKRTNFQTQVAKLRNMWSEDNMLASADLQRRYYSNSDAFTYLIKNNIPVAQK